MVALNRSICTMNSSVMVFVILLVPGVLHAGVISITTANGQGADTFIRGGLHAAENYGGDANLLSRNASGLQTFDRIIYLRFDLSSVTEPVVQAELTVQFFNGTNHLPGDKVRFLGLVDGNSKEAWIEGTGTVAAPASTGLTWASAPMLPDVFLENVPLPATPGFLTLSGGAGSPLVNFINADTNNLVTFIIYQLLNDSDGFGFASKESTGKAPKLTLTTASSAVPEPSSCWTLVLSILSFAATMRIGRSRSRHASG